LRAPRVGSHPDIAKVKNSLASDPDQRGEVIACQQENIIKHRRKDLEFLRAIAVMPRQVSQMQQIEGGLDLRAGELLLDATSAFLTPLLAADWHRFLL
jgi:hypothetical protein